MDRHGFHQLARTAVATHGLTSRCITAGTRNSSNWSKPPVFKLTVSISWIHLQDISHIIRKDDTKIYMHMLTNQTIICEFDNSAQCDQFIANVSDKTRGASAKVMYDSDDDEINSKYKAYLEGRYNNRGE
jgi:hypothetical protein